MKVVAPNRVSRSYTQTLCAEPEQVFPLLCPVREADWIEGWDPGVVITASGVAERDCVFTTDWESRLNRYLLRTADEARAWACRIEGSPNDKG